ncbi:MAG TPA: ergothioneine biosynthesis protein EgtB [Casimicrobiaceae bacterium]
MSGPRSHRDFHIPSSWTNARSVLARRFAAIRGQTEALTAPLAPEDCALQSMPDASPLKWHLGHTTWFFETFVLAPTLRGYALFDPHFRVLFNSYYNGVGDRHPRSERGLLSRPDLATVRAYRAHVDHAMRELLGHDVAGDLAALIELGLHHEQQHQELILTDLKHLFSRNPLRPAYEARWPLLPVKPAALKWHRYDAGLAAIGHRGDGFAFDNEGPEHQVFVAPFELASRPVTHGEFAAFIADGGYRKAELWLSLGFDAVQAQGWHAPLYWEERDGRWWTFTLRGMAEIDPHAPVCHVSYFEADAYARWAGARLPTEFEWEVAGKGVVADGNFVDSGVLHPLPSAGVANGGAPQQLYGDVWEWTSSSYGPYPGFRTAEGAVGEYNGKFMCNQYVLRGGSCATPASHIRATYRNFFPPEARWQFSGIRLARNA